MGHSGERLRAIRRINARWQGVCLFERFVIQQCVRLGQHNALMEGWDRERREEVAIKLPLKRREVYERLMRERIALEEIWDPRIPELRGWGSVGDRYALVMSWKRGPSLAQTLELRGGCARDDVFRYTLDLITALTRVHERGFAFLNLHARNIVCHDGLHLVDFGAVRHVREPMPATVSGGDPRIVDVRALATMSCRMMTPHFDGVTPPTHFADGTHVPAMFRALLFRALDEPARRPTLERFGELVHQLREYSLADHVGGLAESSGVDSTNEWARRHEGHGMAEPTEPVGQESRERIPVFERRATRERRLTPEQPIRREDLRQRVLRHMQEDDPSS